MSKETMTAIQLCQKVADEHQHQNFKENKSDDGVYSYTLVGDKTKGATTLDATTAHAIIAVHKALSDKNKAKLQRMSIFVTIDMVWKVMIK